MRYFVLLLLAASTPAYAADRFDLACQGTKVSQQGGAAAPTSFTVRVDLAAKLWCADACQRITPINDVKPDKIVLADDGTYNSRMDVTDQVMLDPRTYAYKRLMIQERPTAAYLKVEAQCTQQAFTPFPANTGPTNDVGADGLQRVRDRGSESGN